MIMLSAFVWGPESLLHPLALYAALATGLGLCLYLFFSAKIEMRALMRRGLQHTRQLSTVESGLADLGAQVRKLQTEMQEVQQHAGMLVPPEPCRSGLNLSKRTQVLRLHRAGEDAARIAGSLGLPRGEVELLIKVHRIAVEQI